MLVITSDRGLAGAYSSSVIKAGVSSCASCWSARAAGPALPDRPQGHRLRDVPQVRDPPQVGGVLRRADLRRTPARSPTR